MRLLLFVMCAFLFGWLSYYPGFWPLFAIVLMLVFCVLAAGDQVIYSHRPTVAKMQWLLPYCTAAAGSMAFGAAILRHPHPDLPGGNYLIAAAALTAGAAGLVTAVRRARKLLNPDGGRRKRIEWLLGSTEEL